MGRVEFTSNGVIVQEPLPWSVYEVVPLYAADGSLLAYCERGSERMRGNIPTEMFNHEIRILDRGSDEELTRFMSEFGLIGVSFRDHARETVHVMDVKSVEDALKTDEECGFHKGFDEGSVWVGSPEARYEWYQEMQGAAAHAGLGWLGSDSLNPRVAEDSKFVTPDEVRRFLVELDGSVKASCALFESNSFSAIAERLGIPESDVWGELERVANFINEPLRKMSPRIGFAVFDDDGEENGTIGACGDSEGSFDLALLLQVGRFASSRGRQQTCAQCGVVFVERRDEKRDGKARGGKSHGENAFCCAKCRNRFSQARYRERHRQG